MMSTDRQTNKQTNQCYQLQKHNLLCQGGNYVKQSIGMWNYVTADLIYRDVHYIILYKGEPGLKRDM